MKLEILEHIKAVLMDAVRNSIALYYTFLIAMFIGVFIMGLLDPIEKYVHKDPTWKNELKTALIKIFFIAVIGIIVFIV